MRIAAGVIAAVGLFGGLTACNMNTYEGPKKFPQGTVLEQYHRDAWTDTYGEGKSRSGPECWAIVVATATGVPGPTVCLAKEQWDRQFVGQLFKA